MIGLLVIYVVAIVSSHSVIAEEGNFKAVVRREVRCPRIDDRLTPSYLPHLNDCSKFFSCSNGWAHELSCPEGLHFGKGLNRCVFPQEAMCTGINRAAFEISYDDQYSQYPATDYQQQTWQSWKIQQAPTREQFESWNVEETNNFDRPQMPEDSWQGPLVPAFEAQPQIYNTQQQLHVVDQWQSKPFVSEQQSWNSRQSENELNQAQEWSWPQPIDPNVPQQSYQTWQDKPSQPSFVGQEPPKAAPQNERPQSMNPLPVAPRVPSRPIQENNAWQEKPSQIQQQPEASRPNYKPHVAKPQRELESSAPEQQSWESRQPENVFNQGQEWSRPQRITPNEPQQSYQPWQDKPSQPSIVGQEPTRSALQNERPQFMNPLPVLPHAPSRPIQEYTAWQQNPSQMPQQQEALRPNYKPQVEQPQKPQDAQPQTYQPNYQPAPQAQPKPQPQPQTNRPNTQVNQRVPDRTPPQQQEAPRRPAPAPQPEQPQYQTNRYEREQVVEDYVVVPGVVDSRCPRSDDPKRPVHLAVRGNCQKFFKCFGGRAYEMDCPRGLDYNAAKNRCDYPEDARCSL